MNLPAPHRIARLHYLPRTAAFAVTWLGSLALYRDGVIGARHLLYGVLALLVYPQLVHLYACLAQDKKRAAQRNLYLDAFVLATWVAVSAFNFGVFYGLFASVCLNHALNGGLRSVLRAMVAFAAGIVAALMVVDVRFEPDSSAVTAYVALGVLFIYIMGVAALFRAQNAQLVRVMKDVERKQEVFQALASVGAAAAEARTLEELVATTLDHLMRVLPKGPGLGLLVRAPQRPRVVHHVAFRGVPQAEQDWLLAHCIEHPLDTIGALPPGDCARYIIEPVGAGTPQSETLFVLRDDAVVGPLQRETIALFLQQYSSALENYWLTRSLTELANTDRLTGLANRGRLDARLAQLVAQKHTRANDDFSVIVADLNGLKHVNDTHGHALGDRLIAATAQALQRTCRETDVVARMGGDEFVVLCQATISDEAAVLVARLAGRRRGAGGAHRRRRNPAREHEPGLGRHARVRPRAGDAAGGFAHVRGQAGALPPSRRRGGRARCGGRAALSPRQGREGRYSDGQADLAKALRRWRAGRRARSRKTHRGRLWGGALPKSAISQAERRTVDLAATCALAASRLAQPPLRSMNATVWELLAYLAVPWGYC